MYRLVNVPSKDSKAEIRGEVEGETVYVVAAEPNGKWREGGALLMAETYLGDHLLGKPDLLRKKVSDDLATAVRLGRDAGYAQALADVRSLLRVNQ